MTNFTYNTLDQNSYSLLRFNTLKKVEENNDLKEQAYLDSKGIPTIGLGMNLRDENVCSAVVNEIVKNYQDLITEAEKEQIKIEIATVTNKTFSSETQLRSELNAVMEKYATTNAAFSFVNEAQIKAVFDIVVQTYETRVNNWLPNIPDSIERSVLLSLAYNGILNESVSLKYAIQSNNRAEAWYEIRYNSNGDELDGIAKRRYLESETFKLYNDPTNVSDKEAKDVFKMLTKHQSKIDSYEATYGHTLISAESDYGFNIQNLDESIAAARTYLISHYAHGQIIDNILIGDFNDSVISDNLFGSATDSKNDLIFGETGDDILNGNGGNDVLIGGSGNDSLNGGNGSDTYIFNGNFGTDTINDNGLGDGTTKDIIKIDNSIISGFANFYKIINGNPTYQMQIFDPELGSVADYKLQLVDNQLIIISDASNGENSVVINNFSDGDYGITLGTVVPLSDIKVNTYNSGYQITPSVAMLVDGGFVFSWTSMVMMNDEGTNADEGQDGDFSGVYMQRYDANGNRIGAETLVNTTTQGKQASPTVRPLSDGGFDIVWQNSRLDSVVDGNTGFYSQRYDANGGKVDVETRIYGFNYSGNQGISTAAVSLMDGTSIHIRIANGQNGLYGGIYMQKYDSGGHKLGAESLVSNYTGTPHESLSIFTLNNGNFVVSWVSYGQDGSVAGIFMKQFNLLGEVVESSDHNTIGGLSFVASIAGISPDLAEQISQTIYIENEASNFSENIAVEQNTNNNFVDAQGGNDHIRTFFGNDIINAGSGNDTISSGTGNDIITGGSGNDTFIITAENLNGETTITDFEFNNPNEKIDLSAFTQIRGMEDIAITEGSAIIHLTNTDGSTQTIHILNATPEDITADNFIFAEEAVVNQAPTITNNNGSNNTIFTSKQSVNLDSLNQNQSESPIIEFPDGQTVMPETLALNKITAAVEIEGAKVIFKNSVAGFNSSLGWYKIDGLGNISSPQLLFSGAKSIAAGTEFNLGTIEAGEKIGFFIIANGNNVNWQSTNHSSTIAANSTDFINNGTFSFIDNTTGQSANIYNSNSPTLTWHNDADGQDYNIITVDYKNKGTHIYGAVYHSVNQSNLNTDIINHSGAGWDINSNNLLIGFEDLNGGGDRDYNDMLFYLDMGDANENIHYANNPSLNITITDDGNNGNGIISQAIIELDQHIENNAPRVGDNLVFENSSKYNINQETGTITLKDGDSDDSNNVDTGITFNITNNNQTINLSGNSTSQTYQEIINLIKFVHINQDNEQLTNNLLLTTNINISITDDNNQTTNLTQHIEITNHPAQHTTGTENNDILSATNSYIDILTGGQGSDIFSFDNFTDSTINQTDIITDFTQGEDQINLHSLNYANHTITFDDNSDDDITPEGLSYHFDNDNNTVIEDQNNDFAVKLIGHIQLGEGDFGF